MYNPNMGERLGQHISGGIVERDLLGEVKTEYFERFKNAGYFSYRQALATVKEFQPSDPSDPERRFANDLHATIADKLGLEDYSALRFYTAATHTHLDVLHGIDGFFELQYSSEDSISMVTLDVTSFPKESYKADVLVTVPDEGFDLNDAEDKKRYRQCIERAAGEITALLQERSQKQEKT